jgi:hypothetical protein
MIKTVQECHSQNLNMTLTSQLTIDPAAPGNRHDNDKDDITDIIIIPTESEIRSDYPEFLLYPLRSRKSTFQGTECLFDTYFRLCRHDIFAKVKKMIKVFLTHPPGSVERRDRIILSQINTRIFVYSGAGLTSIKSTKKHGIEV